ncbi:hypothetical protein ACWGLF_44440 [Streptomyces puniciscabiei]
MPKLELYRNVRMEQRERLSALAIELGAADITQCGAAAEQADRCLAMTQGLREHADHEDTFIHQLLRERAPEAAEASECRGPLVRRRPGRAHIHLQRQRQQLHQDPPCHRVLTTPVMTCAIVSFDTYMGSFSTAAPRPQRHPC